MDTVLKIILFLVLLPLVLQGISMMFHFIIGGGVGLTALFGMIWDKEERLTGKDGAITGVMFAVAIIIFDVLLLLLGFVFHGVYSWIQGFNELMNGIVLIAAIVSIFRLKFKFGMAMLVVENVIFYLCFRLLYALVL